MKPIQFNEWDGTIPAIVLNMPNEAYHNHDSVSNSGLSLVSRSPGHFAFRASWASTRAMDIGTAFHTALLEPMRYIAEYVTTEGNDRRKVDYKEAAKVYGGDKTLTANEGTSVAVMSESIKANEAAQAELSKEGMAEVSFFAIDPETGIAMRCRFDWLSDDGVAVDLKKTQDCREHAFSKSLHLYRYHCQAAMYSHVYELVTGKPLTAFKFLAVEEQPPCANVLYDLDPLAQQYGHDAYRESLIEYSKASESGIWETYSGSGVVTLPEWVLAMAESDEVIS